VWRPAHACGPVAPPLLDERQADLAADPLAHWGGAAAQPGEQRGRPPRRLGGAHGPGS
jgi:hypothetical protein